MAATKTACPISRNDFRSHAKPLAVNIAGQAMAAGVKEFSTGSFGWHVNGKMVVTINGVPVTAQVNVLLTVVDSKGQ